MNKKIQVIILTSLFLIFIAPVALAKNQPNDHLYTYLSDDSIYKEYKNASITERKKMIVTAYKDLEKDLGKSLIDVDLKPNSISNNNIFFIPSILED